MESSKMLRDIKGTEEGRAWILRLDQWGSEKGAEIKEVLTLGTVYDLE